MRVAASKYGENNEIFIKGVEWAFSRINYEMANASVNRKKFPILHLYDFMDKTLGRKQ